MPKYLFVYHGGSHPESEAEVKEVMDAEPSWFRGSERPVLDTASFGLFGHQAGRTS